MTRLTSHPALVVEPDLDGLDQTVHTHLPVPYLLRRALATIDRNDAARAELAIWLRNANPDRRALAVDELTRILDASRCWVLVDDLDEAKALRDRYDEASLEREPCRGCGNHLADAGDLCGGCADAEGDTYIAARAV
jgi:hypothetical protein